MYVLLRVCVCVCVYACESVWKDQRRPGYVIALLPGVELFIRDKKTINSWCIQ